MEARPSTRNQKPVTAWIGCGRPEGGYAVSRLSVRFVAQHFFDDSKSLLGFVFAKKSPGVPQTAGPPEGWYASRRSSYGLKLAAVSSGAVPGRSCLPTKAAGLHHYTPPSLMISIVVWQRLPAVACLVYSRRAETGMWVPAGTLRRNISSTSLLSLTGG